MFFLGLKGNPDFQGIFGWILQIFHYSTVKIEQKCFLLLSTRWGETKSNDIFLHISIKIFDITYGWTIWEEGGQPTSLMGLLLPFSWNSRVWSFFSSTLGIWKIFLEVFKVFCLVLKKDKSSHIKNRKVW